MIKRLILFFITLLSHLSTVICFQYDEYQGIQSTFEDMTEIDVYKKWIRPPVSDGTGRGKVPLVVNVSIDLYNYATVDEITSEYTFHLFVDLEWFDKRLEFSANKDKYEEDDVIEGGMYHINRIWYPSVFVPNNQDPGSFDYDNQSANLCKIKHNGYVWMRKRKMLRIYCDMDFRQYPFDQQICKVDFESSVSTIDNMLFQWRETSPFNKADSFHTIGFALKDFEIFNSVKNYSKGNSFSRVSIKFILEREWAHYLFLFYMPTALIVITSWSSFWLEITSPPARVSIGVTTMLALVTAFKNTKSQLPSVSYWNALDIWNMVCIIFIFASLMEFACVNYIFNTEKRRRKNKKLKKKIERRKSVDYRLVHDSRMSSVSTLESIFTLSSVSELNKRMSFDDSNNNSRASDSDLPVLDSSKRRRSSASGLAFDFAKQMPDIKEEEVLGAIKRERSNTIRSVKSRRSSLAQQTNYDLKLTPQEFANEIDQKSRRIFPLCFLVFNLIYWPVLQIKM